MKYWWLEKYQNLEVKMLPELFLDIQYFLTMPKNYLQVYKKIENLPISELSEEEMCIALYYISVTKNVKDNKICQIIEQLLLVPDTSLPISDYNLSEIIHEIWGLKKKKATVNQMDSNNVAACYSCLNVFYVDKITSINKKGQCLCPFCGKNKLYFDNELIPMNYSFLFHSKIFYGISELGCDFARMKKIIKRSISIIDKSVTKKNSTDKELKQTLKPFQKKIIKGRDEPRIIKAFYDSLFISEKSGDYQAFLVINWEGEFNLFELSYLLLLSCTFALGNFFYLKHITLVIENKKLRVQTEKILKELIKS